MIVWPLSVVSGISTTSLPATTGSALNSTVSSRLSRTRDATAAVGVNEIKWPELLDKFKQTQERARRRNERLLRGELDAETPISAIQSAADDAGRSSRASLRDGGIGGVTDGDAFRSGHKLHGGRPLSGVGATGTGSGLVKPATGLAITGVGGPGARTVGAGDDRVGPHKRGHSLAGGFGKFASGIARAGGSKDREKKK
ncbi:hypothetical protein FOPE_12505 [Fonsecaea pedrosoi]|nr:hypothetical protein FOPE_12505 [Fonsecaea pedrosoi]